MSSRILHRQWQWMERRVRKSAEAEKSTSPKHTHHYGSCCPLVTLMMLSSRFGTASLPAKQGMALSPQIYLLVFDFKVDHNMVERRACVRVLVHSSISP